MLWSLDCIAWRSMVLEETCPRSLKAFRPWVTVSMLQNRKEKEFKTGSGRCFLMLMYTSILLKLLVLWQDRLQRVNDDCNRVCLDCKCPKLDMQGPEHFFQWRVQTAFCEVPSSLRVDGCWPNQRISGQGKWSRSSDLIASDPVFCWTSLSCQSEFHQNQNSMIPVSQPHDTMPSSWSAIAATYKLLCAKRFVWRIEQASNNTLAFGF